MKIAVFGASGLVGSYLCKSLENAGHSVIKLSKTSSGMDFNIDASDFSQTESLLKKLKPQIIINAIKPNLSTDECEIKKGEAHRYLVQIPQNLSKLAKQLKCKFIHFSTDWVYEGKEGEEYDETSPTNPLNYYSIAKLEAENLALTFCPDALILRIEGVFGKGRDSSFFSRLASSLKEKKEFLAASDQFSQPIYAGEIARILCILIEKNASGIYNLVGPQLLSRYSLAIKFAKKEGLDASRIFPSKSSGRAIKIPMHLKVSIRKIENIVKLLSLDEQINIFLEDDKNE
ncbi:hypothetical protein COU37_05600 [Candidatus Micrarchaeota archaeon CG10_big_fil_rev_8_21_14_0_10_45_29]|nr:MAG: hypothetical protein COU37_05600 [Candidatus Micrarchaeota archaeon CG10_big_fil_rev_8_21_14_0_10_45_29]